MLKDLTLSQALDGYTLDMGAGNYSDNTLLLYRKMLAVLTRYLSDPPITSITPDKLSEFMVYLKTDYIPFRYGGSKSPVGPSCVDNYWKAIRSFYKWAGKPPLNLPNISTHLVRPRYKHPEIAPYSKEQINTLLSACDSSVQVNRTGCKPYHLPRNSYGLRDKAIILTLYDTGLRVGELCRAEIRDLNLDTGMLNIAPYGTGRKTKPRVVFLGKSTKRAVWLYLADRNSKGITSLDDKVFPIHQSGVRRLMKELQRKTGIDKVHPHRFRHTFAIEYLRNGGDVFTLQRLLGHSDLSMVKHYIDLADSDAANAHRKASPADRL